MEAGGRPGVVRDRRGASSSRSPPRDERPDDVVQRFGELYAATRARSGETKRRPTRAPRSCYPDPPELFDGCRRCRPWSVPADARGAQAHAGVVHSLWERGDGKPADPAGAVPLDDRCFPQPHAVASTTAGADHESELTDSHSPLRRPENAARMGATPRAACRGGRFFRFRPAGGCQQGDRCERVLLGSVQPGEARPLRETRSTSRSQATYLYENAGRYWYANPALVNQLARDPGSSRRPTGRDGDRARLKRRFPTGVVRRVAPSPKSGSTSGRG